MFLKCVYFYRAKPLEHAARWPLGRVSNVTVRVIINPDKSPIYLEFVRIAKNTLLWSFVRPITVGCVVCVG